MKKSLFFILAAISPLLLFGRYDAARALSDAPDSLMCLLSRTDRLDLIDYFNASMTDHSVRNRLGGEARLQALDSVSATLTGGNAQRIDLRLLPANADTLIAVIETFETPTPDSRLTVYDRSWRPRAKAWTAPAAKEWGKTDAPFLLTEYTLSGDTLTLTDRTGEWAESAPSVHEIKYLWTPSKERFTRLK